MPIVRLTDLPINPQAGWTGRFRRLGEQPRVYREILMRADDQHASFYNIAVPALTAVTVRVPHGLSRDANDAAMPGMVILPDVIIPVRGCNISSHDEYDLGNVDVLTTIDGDGIVISTGMGADGNYVYVTLINREAVSRIGKFIVYIEYTHSAIGAEVYTGSGSVVYSLPVS